MASSRVVDVQVALQRAKKKICRLQRHVSNTETSESSAESSRTTWTPSKELRDSLVDMYTANPRVNVELRQRLPSPARQQLINPDRSSLSPEHIDWPQASQHLQHPLTSCSSSPRSIRRSASPVSPLSSRPPGGGGEMELDLSPGRGPSPLAESCADGPDGSPAFRKHLVNTDDSCHQDASLEEVSVRVQPPQQNRNVSLLLKELDTLREINKKVQTHLRRSSQLCDQLTHKEEELQRRDVEEQLREEQREAKEWERPTAVLEEVLATQKDRDHALMSRLLLANEERDEALLRARRLQQAAELENLNLEDTDMEVNELLRCVCDAVSVQEVEHFGSVLVQRVRLASQRRNDITAQEMKAVMEERDGSVAKFKRLEQDLMQERERTSKEDLLRLQRERDAAVEDRRRLEAELQTLRANHSSRGLLTPPSLAADCSSAAAGPLQSPPPPQAPPPKAQLQQLSKEKQSVEAELQRCQEAEREAIDRVRRLERLVEVLRKKVGTGNLRSVI
ncbi:mirror-image polydactyly gene 1 protein isoform X1 [Thunnus thynnus]|uniref:mirror-image polydactyly gene 1 protein isoform X1 n=1 Tax=Thunnus thynnus TaxID=8237 RepID=UPI003528D5EC